MLLKVFISLFLWSQNYTHNSQLSYFIFHIFRLSDIYFIPLIWDMHRNGRCYLNNNKQKKVISIVNICLTLKRHVKTVFIRISWKMWLCVPRDYQHSNGATRIQYCCARNIRLIIVRGRAYSDEVNDRVHRAASSGSPYYLIISSVNYGSPRFVLAAQRQIRERALVQRERFSLSFPWRLRLA